MAMLTAWCIFGGIAVIFLPEYNNGNSSAAQETDADEER